MNVAEKQSRLEARLAHLSPEKRELVLKQLRKQKQQTTRPQSKQIAAIKSVSRDQQLPLSFAQQRLWFMAQLDGGSAAYNAGSTLRLRGPLNRDALCRSLQEIETRHEALRTTFPIQNEQVSQHINAPSLHIEEHALLDLPTEAQEAEVRRLAVQSAQQAFDLVQGPLWRVTLVQLATEEHVLIFTFHHICIDDWSMGILFDELATHYAAHCRHEPVDMPDLEIQYADYAAWQQSWLTGPVREQHLEYWRQQLDDAPELINLPTDYPRPAIQSYRGAHHFFTLPKEQTEALKRLAQQTNTTLFMTLQAVFALLLSRYASQEDILIGTPITNRHNAQIEPLIGLFVNMLVLRNDLSGNPTFYEFLERVRGMTLAAYGHQALPFEVLVDELQPERSLGYNPLFQVMFVFVNKAQGELALHNLTIDPMDIAAPMTKFDIHLNLYENEHGIDGVWEYSTDLFTSATIERMSAGFQVLLEMLTTGVGADQPIGNLSPLTTAERHQLLRGWNETTTPYPHEQCVHQLIEAQAMRTPNAIAVVYAGTQSAGQSDTPTTLTYDALNTRANQLAHHLRAMGVGQETLVGLCVERSLEMMVGLLGILKAGATYVPLDPAFPAERLAFMMEDAAISVLLIQQPLREKLSLSAAQVICLDSDWPQIASQPNQNLLLPVAPSRLAYVIYTSGSTGRPKGVQVHHQALTNFLWTMKDRPGVHAQDTLLSVTTLSFDIAALELYLPLIVGGQVVLVDQQTTVDGTALAAVLAKHQVTVMQATPATWRLLLESGWQGQSQLKILCGGEALPWDLSQRLLDCCHELWNVYGPTETTIWSTVHPIRRTDDRILIGRPIANTQLYILDDFLNPVPIGATGTLYIGGEGVAVGYLNRPALTAERFIDNPFGAGRIYNTGDLARYQADGSVVCLGRVDHQVKIRGFRIELGEIESALTDYTGIRQAVVMAREETLGHRQLVAYLAADQVDTQIELEHAQGWQSLWDESYRQPVQPDDLAFNLAGWNSSYTGAPIPQIEMAEWVDETVADIQRLQPQRILEIGCGTGLLLARLAADVEVYWGTDYAPQAIQHVERLKTANPKLDHVHVEQRMADDLTGIEADDFDCIILNSVIQYFPSVDYLLRVIEGALRVVKPGGVIYIGDVRNLALINAFHAAIQLYQAEDDLALPQLQTRIQQRRQDETELLIAPDFFHALRKLFPQIAGVDISLKRGQHHNELSQFRYRAALYIGEENSSQPTAGTHAHHRQESEWQELSWTHTWSVDSLKETLQQICTRLPSDGASDGVGQGIIIRNIPDARTQAAIHTLVALGHGDTHQTGKTAAQLRTYLAEQPSGIDPESIWALADLLADGLPIAIHLAPASVVGMMDACVTLRQPMNIAGDINGDSNRDSNRDSNLWSAQSPNAAKPLDTYANNPLLGKLSRMLVPKVRTWLLTQLPDYMVPASFMMLEHMPLTPNGKIDRNALPAPTKQIRLQRDYVPPRDDMETAVANIWQQHFGVEQIGIHDNFFADLGGDSLNATRLVNQLQQQLGKPVSIASLFENPTVAQIAAYLQWATDSREADIVIPQRHTRQFITGGWMPLLYTQLPLIPPETAAEKAYVNVLMSFEITGQEDVDVVALQNACEALVKRHEVLRLRVAHRDEQWMQQVADEVVLPFVVVDASDWSEEQLLDESQAIGRYVFNLAEEPPLRVYLYTHSTMGHLLLLLTHHIVTDNWSSRLIVEELQHLYQAQVTETRVSLPDLSWSFTDYVQWQHETLSGPQGERLWHYWRTQLSGWSPGLNLPLDHVRPPVLSHRGAGYEFEFDTGLTASIRAVAHQEEATVYLVMQAALQLLLHALSGQPDLVVGGTVNNRVRPELDRMVGSMADAVILRATLPSDTAMPFTAYLRQVRTTVVDAFAHQGYPSELLAERLGIEAEQGQPGLVQVSLNYVRGEDQTVAIEGETEGETGGETQSQSTPQLLPAKLPIQAVGTWSEDVVIGIGDDGEKLHGYARYSTDIFEEETIMAMMRAYQRLLQAIAHQPARSIAELRQQVSLQSTSMTVEQG
ncbi:MAG: amino acid adenylation domain-containing protein [Chloroflexota bacterium]